MKLAVVGLGAVGEACAHLLVSRTRVRQLVLANRTVEIADATREDLEQSRAWGLPLSARAVTPWSEGAFDGCDVIVLTAGPRLRGIESRADKAAATARLLSGSDGQSIVSALAAHRMREDAAGLSHERRSVLLVVSNPVEATVSWLGERTGWAHERLIGLGTTVETARLSRLLADGLSVDARSVWAEVVGEHGPKIALADEDAVRRRVRALGDLIDVGQVLKRVTTAAAEIRQISEAEGKRRAESLLRQLRAACGPDALSEQVSGWLEETLSRELAPPATRFAIAAAVVEVVDAIVSDRARVFTVSGYTSLLGLEDIAVAAPFVIGRGGVITCAAAELPIYNDVAADVRSQLESMRAIV